MKEYAKKPENASRTLDSNPKASKQASINQILQRYKDRIEGKPVQRQSINEEELLQAKATQQDHIKAVLQRYSKKNIQRHAPEEDEELIQGKFDTAQREEIDEEELLQGKFESDIQTEQEPVQREEKPNNTGLPDNLKTGIENLSGYSMDDVKVHYNSDKPAQLNALAYAQGTDIHVAPGQKEHLPHEAWHVVQQMQGRVQPTMQMQGVNVNDNEGLEREADVMGGEAIRKIDIREHSHNVNISRENIVQCVWERPQEGLLKWNVLINGLQWYYNENTKKMYFKVEEEKKENEYLKSFQGKEYSYEDWRIAGWPGMDKHKDIGKICKIRRTGEKGKIISEYKGKYTVELCGKEERVIEHLEKGNIMIEPDGGMEKWNMEYFSYIEYLKEDKEEKSLKDSLGNLDDIFPYKEEEYKLMEEIAQKSADNMEGLIDQIYSKIPWEGKVRIAVYTERQGLGDVSLAMKVVKMFRDAFPTANEKDIALLMDIKTRTKTDDLGKSYGINPISLPFDFDSTKHDKFTFLEEKYMPQMFIRVPVMQSISALDELRKFNRFASDKKVHHLGFTEYAKEELDSAPTGLKPKELGITIDSDLRAYKEKLSKEEDKKIYKFSLLDKIQDETLLSTISDNKNLDQFKQSNTKLYFGYTNRSGTKFVKTIAELEKDNKEDVVIVHSGSYYIEKYWQGFKDEIESSYKDKLKILGFKKIEVIIIDSTKKETKKECDIKLNGSDDGKIMRVIFISRISHDDMLTLFKSSEQTSMVTGNQSTSEAISAGKTILYECLSFPQNQQFMLDLFSFGQKEESEAGKRMQEFYEYQREMSRDIISGGREEVKEDTFEKIADMLKKEEIHKNFSNISDLAFTAKNLESRLIGDYKRSILMSFDELKPKLSELEETLKTNKNFEDFANNLKVKLIEVKK